MSRITVVVPAFNLERYVAECLDSVVSQLPPSELQLVVIDDCSTDGTVAVIEEWIARTGRSLTFIRNERNLGAPRTFNRAIREARAPFLSVIDADDVLVQGGLEPQLRLLERGPTGIAVAYGDCRRIDENGVDLAGRRLDRERDLGGPFQGSILPQLLRYGAVLPVTGTVVRTAVFREVGGYDESLIYCDWPLWLKIAHRWRFAYSGSVAGAYRRHALSMTQTRAAELRRDRVQILLAILPQLTDELARGAARHRLRSTANTAYVSSDPRVAGLLWRAAVHARSLHLASLSLLSAVGVPPAFVRSANRALRSLRR